MVDHQGLPRAARIGVAPPGRRAWLGLPPLTITFVAVFLALTIGDARAANAGPAISAAGYLGACTGGGPHLAVATDIAYVADGARISIVDVTDLAHPRVVGRVNAPFPVKSIAAAPGGIQALCGPLGAPGAGPPGHHRPDEPGCADAGA